MMDTTIDRTKSPRVGVRQFALLAALASLLYRDALEITATQILLHLRQARVALPWEMARAPHELAAVLPLLLTASIISQSSAAGVTTFLGNRDLPRSVQLGLSAAERSPAFALLGYHKLIYDSDAARSRFPQFNRTDSYDGLRELQRSFSLRIEFLQRDRYNWNATRPRVELIDWPYLLASIALVRDETLIPKFIDTSAPLRPAPFMEQLAVELASRLWTVHQ